MNFESLIDSRKVNCTAQEPTGEVGRPETGAPEIYIVRSLTRRRLKVRHTLTRWGPLFGGPAHGFDPKVVEPGSQTIQGNFDYIFHIVREKGQTHEPRSTALNRRYEHGFRYGHITLDNRIGLAEGTSRICLIM